MDGLALGASSLEEAFIRRSHCGIWDDNEKGILCRLIDMGVPSVLVRLYVIMRVTDRLLDTRHEVR